MSLNKQGILELLKKEILSLELKPGTIISEATLTERFQLSRTPIRDILKQLSIEGYIDIYPQRGSLVSFIDIDSVEQIIYLRSTLEKEVMKDLSEVIKPSGVNELNTILITQQEYIDQMATSKDFMTLDDAFHKACFYIAGRIFLWQVIQQHNAHYIRYRRLHMLNKEKLIKILNEHKLLLSYIQNGETNKIDELINQHIRNDVKSTYFQQQFSEYIKS